MMRGEVVFNRFSSLVPDLPRSSLAIHRDAFVICRFCFPIQMILSLPNDVELGNRKRVKIATNSLDASERLGVIDEAHDMKQHGTGKGHRRGLHSGILDRI